MQLAEGAYSKTAEALIAFGHRAGDIVSTVTEKTAEAASLVGEKTVEAANIVGDKTVEAYHIAGDKTVEAYHIAGDKAVEAYSKLGMFISSARSPAIIALLLIPPTGDKTADARHKAKDTALLIKHKTYEAAALFGHKTADIASVVGPLALDIAAEAKTRLVHLTDEIAYSTTRAYLSIFVMLFACIYLSVMSVT